MCAQRLADLRSTITTLDSATEHFRILAQTRLNIEVADARFEKRVAAMKGEHLASTNESRAVLRGLEKDLALFINTHRDLFQKPRKITTPFGTFGLQKATGLKVVDKVALLAELVVLNLISCMKVTRRPINAEIRKVIDSGTSLPGVVVTSGDTAVCTVAKSLIQEAREKALE